MSIYEKRYQDLIKQEQKKSEFEYLQNVVYTHWDFLKTQERRTIALEFIKKFNIVETLLEKLLCDKHTYDYATRVVIDAPEADFTWYKLFSDVLICEIKKFFSQPIAVYSGPVYNEVDWNTELYKKLDKIEISIEIVKKEFKSDHFDDNLYVYRKPTINKSVISHLTPSDIATVFYDLEIENKLPISLSVQFYGAKVIIPKIPLSNLFKDVQDELKKMIVHHYADITLNTSDISFDFKDCNDETTLIITIIPQDLPDFARSLLVQ